MSQKDIVVIGLLVAIAAGLLAHAFFPRYEWRTIQDGSGATISIVVYDRWAGRFQRAVYDDKGNLNAMGVFTPF